MFNVYLPSDRVFILPLELEGVVVGVYHSIGSIEYKVKYYKESNPLECYFYEFELAKT
jgi:hypothetical protein